MTKDHLKRINAPRTWNINRKKNTFITRPMPSGHRMKHSVPLVVLFRDMLKKVKTTNELEYIINTREVYINSKRAYSPRQAVGLMDVVRLPEIKENYRVVLNSSGQLDYVSVDEKESKIMPLVVKNKTKIKGGKTQVNFTDGSNMLVDKDEYTTQDVLFFDFLNNKIVKHLKFEKGAVVYFTRGKYVGTTAVIQEISEKGVLYKRDGSTFETGNVLDKDYTFLVGKESPEIKLAD
ncbi:MAG: hypothetical protein ACQESF_05470 [Nanobdellota archaeon]